MLNKLPAPRKVPVAVGDVRQVRLWIERASQAVHSEPGLRRENKVHILATLKKVKNWCDATIQLELFAPENLES